MAPTEPDFTADIWARARARASCLHWLRCPIPGSRFRTTVNLPAKFRRFVGRRSPNSSDTRHTRHSIAPVLARRVLATLSFLFRGYSRRGAPATTSLNRNSRDSGVRVNAHPRTHVDAHVDTWTPEYATDASKLTGELDSGQQLKATTHNLTHVCLRS